MNSVQVLEVLFSDLPIVANLTSLNKDTFHNILVVKKLHKQKV